MRTVNIHEAKTHLSRLLQRAAAGEEIIIAKAGAPLAKLGPCHGTSEPRRPGLWRGKVRIADDFDVLPEDLAAAFRGEG
ncbi:MAG TPA: type II toxin-antitoxin system prevent-host-death family antitoxin [Candidatus Hydrogenedentes bacterium]|nr:type II toxin-antitoxin system prevent-host-death family antitoxin [Candidatus Hydrogenedentota bacterium]